jgi:uncharacterized membrane protein YphA (DoxX/SURF4 family)
MGFVVTFVELVGGILLMVGLLSRLAALVLTIHLTVALLPVKVDVGLIAPHSAGAELDLALIAGLLVILLAGRPASYRSIARSASKQTRSKSNSPGYEPGKSPGRWSRFSP